MTRHTRGEPGDRWVAPVERNPAGRTSRGGTPQGGLLTPARVVAVIALVGSLAYLAYAVAVVRDTSAIPMLAGGAVVLGIVFLALAAMGARAMIAAGRDGRGGNAMALAVGGGVAAMIGFGCFAAAIVLALVLQGG